ncbi:nitroreductase family deazaflavin-dependent oxidoreductase [Myxococcota bacterium]|nr:nitroreductase family deazaflavin-dependent oxidoreductase [Myxococcota bacterium]
MIRNLLVVLGLFVFAIGGLVWWVLESSGVAIVETQSAEGHPRKTHVWYVRQGRTIWLEAGRPNHAWYKDLQAHPTVHFESSDLSGHYEAATVPGPEAHRHIRALLAEKYGVRDRILGWAVDTSSSIAVRLDPASPSR